MISEIRQKVSYLQGLCDGLDITESDKQGKVLMKIIDILDDISGELAIISEVQSEIVEQVNEIDDDLGEVEDYLFEGVEMHEHDDDDDDEGIDFLDGFDCDDVQCPNCGKTIFLDSEIIDAEHGIFSCPECGEKIEVECDCDDCQD